ERWRAHARWPVRHFYAGHGSSPRNHNLDDFARLAPGSTPLAEPAQHQYARGSRQRVSEIRNGESSTSGPGRSFRRHANLVQPGRRRDPRTHENPAALEEGPHSGTDRSKFRFSGRVFLLLAIVVSPVHAPRPERRGIPSGESADSPGRAGNLGGSLG